MLRIPKSPLALAFFLFRLWRRLPPAQRRMVMRLDFVEPMQTSSQAEFSLRPLAAGGTEVRWAMHGPAPFVSKLMGLLFDMDKMIGKDFEDGLANLKQLAEKPQA